MLQRHAPRVGADPCVCPPYLPILFAIVRADRLLPSSRRGWGRWSAPTCGCTRGGLGLCVRRIGSWARAGWGRFKGGFKAVYPKRGEFGAIFDRGGGVFRYSFLHCKDTKKSWNFQIVSRKNCTFGDKNCTFESFWCFLEECRSTKVLKAFSLPRLQSPFYRFSVTRYRLQFFYEPIIRRDAWKIAKYVSKKIYYLYIIDIYYI